jgi:hypothetical protein
MIRPIIRDNGKIEVVFQKLFNGMEKVFAIVAPRWQRSREGAKCFRKDLICKRPSTGSRGACAKDDYRI